MMMPAQLKPVKQLKILISIQVKPVMKLHKAGFGIISFHMLIHSNMTLTCFGKNSQMKPAKRTQKAITARSEHAATTVMANTTSSDIQRRKVR